eukprot:COSAG01_NODE_1729_length_9372_cov_17.444948_8_plen_57_part_00
MWVDALSHLVLFTNVTKLVDNFGQGAQSNLRKDILLGRPSTSVFGFYSTTPFFVTA